MREEKIDVYVCNIHLFRDFSLQQVVLTNGSNRVVPVTTLIRKPPPGLMQWFVVSKNVRVNVNACNTRIHEMTLNIWETDYVRYEHS